MKKFTNADLKEILTKRGYGNVKILSEAKGSKEPILIKYPCGHDKWVRQGSLVNQKVACCECEPISLSHKDFQKRVDELFGNIEVEKYINTRQKATFKCRIDGRVWKAFPHDLHVCKACSDLKKSLSKKKSLENMPSTVKCLSTESEFRGVRNSKSIKFQCLLCMHKWNTSLKSAIQNKFNCPSCTNKAMGKKLSLSNKEYVRRVSEIAPTLKPVSKYVKASEKIKMLCTCCNHKWDVKPHSILEGTGCPKCLRCGYSKSATEWLDDFSSRSRLKIEHAENAEEFRIDGTKYRADGFNRKHNIVFEFLGDYWHGNPDTRHGKTELGISRYQKSIKKINTLLSLGITVVFLWENDANLGRKPICIVPSGNKLPLNLLYACEIFKTNYVRGIRWRKAQT